MIAATIIAIALQTSDWPLGREREVDEGLYMKVIDQNNGWRIWQSESQNGTICKAVKSARDRPHPIPVGVGTGLFRGTPFLEIHVQRHGFSGRPIYSYNWRTAHYGKVEIEYRLIGDRFYTKSNNGSFDGDSVDQSSYEITLTSFEYPAILRGRAEEKAVFDFEGLEWARTRTLECQDYRPS
ncbi:hypothetical protein [Brevundimonas diminuta]|uniref:hypothetical protein n=1 Tax=Brevundimonas diminuta TaxID=293 RepID=UPI0011779C33|nr:hypothetical protein [Brevundimonas diminuta]